MPLAKPLTADEIQIIAAAHVLMQGANYLVSGRDEKLRSPHWQHAKVLAERILNAALIMQPRGYEKQR